MQIDVSILISAGALSVSLLTAWLTLLHRGTIRMTQPSTIFFGPDAGPIEDRKPKVYFRSLLYSTSTRGRVVEGMFVKLRRNESAQNFSVWVYGEKDLARGSGLYVGEGGIATNHHFLTPKDENSFRFEKGIYRFQVFAHLVSRKDPVKLFSYELPISEEHAAALRDSRAGLFFDWAPEAQTYLSHISTRTEPTSAEALGGLRLAYDVMRFTTPQPRQETK